MQKFVYKRPIATKSGNQRSVVIKCHILNNSIKIALKEWAPAVKALTNGDQTVLLRKGGIKEPTFTTKAPSFLLFPTAFHTDASLLKPELQSKYQAECEIDPKGNTHLEFDCIVEVTGQWKTTNPDVPSVLNPLHIYGPNFLEARLRWRPTQPLTVLELRAYRLIKPLVVAAKEEFWGCFSWVDFQDDTNFTFLGRADSDEVLALGNYSLQDLVKHGYLSCALDDATFAEKQELCRKGLSQLEDLEIL